MSLAVLRRLPVATLIVVASACGAVKDAADVLAPAPGQDFVVSVRGLDPKSFGGLSHAVRIPDGYGETAANGIKSTTDVVLVSLSTEFVLSPTVTLTFPTTNLNIGLMGPLAPGVYHFRTPGGAALPGITAEFYGSYTLRNADGSSRSYTVTSGTVTIDAVQPTVHGSFSFHSASFVTIPADAAGVVLTGQPANVDLTGVFTTRVSALLVNRS